ncbi:hypothetical protein AVEN_188730-1 [Araneus ventricosus]|uniref:Uncharacterized protein n=1 Tax=Araneus ventricosus TaxID=182803 RepID=A0A4Y2S5I0_ARAVE|nr:hypothetical protein AVEN_188730-1 [Araneus ventricosus]
MVENALKGLPREPSLLIGRSFGRRVLSDVILNSLRQYPLEPIVNEIVSLAKIIGLEVDNNGIDELVEEHIQELATAYFTFFLYLWLIHRVSQQDVMEEILTEEEEVTTKQQFAESIENCCILL